MQMNLDSVEGQCYHIGEPGISLSDSLALTREGIAEGEVGVATNVVCTVRECLLHAA